MEHYQQQNTASNAIGGVPVNTFWCASVDCKKIESSGIHLGTYSIEMRKLSRMKHVYHDCVPAPFLIREGLLPAGWRTVSLPIEGKGDSFLADLSWGRGSPACPVMGPDIVPCLSRGVGV